MSRRSKSFPMSSWPAGVKDTILKAIEGGRVKRATGRAHSLAPLTPKTAAACLFALKQFVLVSGISLDSKALNDCSCWGERHFVDDAVEFWLEDDLKPSSIVTQLEKAAIALTRGGFEVTWMRLAISDIQRANCGTKVKKKAPATSEELFSLGKAIMDEARQKLVAGRDSQALFDYRDGLMVAILALVPLRISNLLHLELGSSLNNSGSDWHIAIESEETKTRQSIVRVVPAVIVPDLECYLLDVRPDLVRGPQVNSVFLGLDGQALKYLSAYNAIRKWGHEKLDRELSPHMFRHAAASHANGAGLGLKTGAAALGHGNMTTTERHYASASAPVDPGIIAKTLRV